MFCTGELRKGNFDEDRRACSGARRNLELATEPGRAFPHPQKAEVAGLYFRWIESVSVVRDRKEAPVGRISKRIAHFGSIRMLDSVGQRFLADPEKVVLDQGEA